MNSYLLLSKLISKFEEEYNVNRLGVYNINRKDVDTVLDKSIIDQFFPVKNAMYRYSRGCAYFDINVLLENRPSLYKLIEAFNEFDKSCKVAVLELIINTTYLLWINSVNETEIFIDSYNYNNKYYTAMIEYIGYFTANIISNDGINLHDKSIISIIKEFDYSRTLISHNCEYDNKFSVIKEICNIEYSGILNEFDSIVFPMYGALYIAAFYKVINNFYLKRNIELFYLRIGFHDQNTEINSFIDNHIIYRSIQEKKIKNILLIDDNIGTGMTINACKYIFEKIGCNFSARVCEIPWRLLFMCSDYEAVINSVTFLTSKDNIIIRSKKNIEKSLIDCNNLSILESSRLSINNSIKMRKNNYNRLLREKINDNQRKYLCLENKFFEIVESKNSIGEVYV